MPLNIVLDTNIWVSYFINARADYLVKWILNHDIAVFTSDELIEELDEVLLRPKFKIVFPVDDFVELHKKVCTRIKVITVFDEAPDPEDNFLFDLCMESNAEYLITSDKKLLNYSPPFNLSIISFNQIRSLVG